MTHDEALALARRVVEAAVHQSASTTYQDERGLFTCDVLGLAASLLRVDAKRVEAERNLMESERLRVEADNLNRQWQLKWSRAVGTGTSNTMREADRADKADARIRELEAVLRDARVYVKEACWTDKYAEDPAKDTRDRIDALLARKEDR